VVCGVFSGYAWDLLPPLLLSTSQLQVFPSGICLVIDTSNIVHLCCNVSSILPYCNTFMSHCICVELYILIMFHSMVTVLDVSCYTMARENSTKAQRVLWNLLLARQIILLTTLGTYLIVYLLQRRLTLGDSYFLLICKVRLMRFK
jgi:hypothetical protein